MKLLVKVKYANIINIINKKEVRAFGLHIESIENISDFEVAAKKSIEAQKPIVVLKTGKSKIGATLTKSHTGSIAGSQKIYNSFCLALF